MTDFITLPPANMQASVAAQNNRGLELMRAGAPRKALECFDAALAAAPNLAPAHFNRGNALSMMGHFAEALQSYERALALGLDIPGLHYRRGFALCELGYLQAALESNERALVMQPNMLAAIYRRGYILENMGRLAEAQASYRRSLASQPDSPQAKLSLAMMCLALGEWREGWELYEARWAGAHETRLGRVKRPRMALPQWNGETDTSQDGLLVFAEQGMGDVMQFARYLPLAAERFAKVTLVCFEPLTRLLRASFPPTIEIVDTFPQDTSSWKWQCPIMSLPRAFGTTPENVPDKTPYLAVPQEWIAKWQTRLNDVAGNRPRIGLVWSGFKNHKSDAKRSIALEKFAPLLGQSGIAWVSLQKGEGAQQRARLPEAANLLDWMDEVGDFADTAALVSALDRIITIDTSVAHLAAALGKPVWMLNRFESEWRWMRDREDSPWYPAMKIFNQKVAGDWDEVLGRVRAELEKHLAG